MLARRPLPVAGEYVRLMRSLTYAYIWETWPDTSAIGPAAGAGGAMTTGAPLGHHVAEVLVIGSGAGGATTAAVLAEAGFDVLVLEEGADVRQGEVVPFSLEQMDRQYRAGGVTAAIGFPSIAYTEGCCVGGGTEINSGLYRRPPEDVLARWRTTYEIAGFGTDELYAICDEVEQELSVQTGARRPDRRRARPCAAAPRRSTGVTRRSRAG